MGQVNVVSDRWTGFGFALSVLPSRGSPPETQGTEIVLPRTEKGSGFVCLLQSYAHSLILRHLIQRFFLLDQLFVVAV